MRKSIIGCLLSGVAAFGGSSSCPTASLQSEGSPGSGETVPGPLKVGCAAIEVTFISFGSSGALNGITNPGLGAFDTYLFEVGSGTLASQDTSTLPATGGTGTAGADGVATNFMNNAIFGVAAGNTAFDNASYGLTDSIMSGILPVMTTLSDFVEPTFVVPTFGSPTATLRVCSQLGLLAGSCTSGSTLSALFPLLTSANAPSVFLPLQPTSINLATTMSLTSGGGTADPGFLTFDDVVDAPEPSTFILLGSAIASVGLLRYRRRKSAIGTR